MPVRLPDTSRRTLPQVQPSMNRAVGPAVGAAVDRIAVRDRGPRFPRERRWEVLVDGAPCAEGMGTTRGGAQALRRQLITQVAANGLGIDAAALQAALRASHWTNGGWPPNMDGIVRVLRIAVDAGRHTQPRAVAAQTALC